MKLRTLPSVPGRLVATACALVVLAGPVALADTDNRPIVVFRVDDGSITWKTPFPGLAGFSAWDYGRINRIPITWAVVTGWTGVKPWTMTWSDFQGYLDAAGGEAASHSCTHEALGSNDAYIADLANSKAALLSRLPQYFYGTFVQPGVWKGDAAVDSFSKLDNAVGQALQANYQQSQAALSSGWFIGDVYNHYRYGMETNRGIDYRVGGTTIPELLASLDLVAATPGLVYVVSAHGVQDAGGTEEYRTRADVMKAFMDKLAQLRDEGKARLMCMRDAYNTMCMQDAYNTLFSANLNHVPDPGFEMSGPAPLSPYGPWAVSGAATLLPSGGVDDSRYAQIPRRGGPQDNSSVQSFRLMLEPGRYEVTWYQKLEPGFPTDRPLQVALKNYVGYASENLRMLIDYALYYSPTPGVWEQRKAYVVVEDRIPTAQISFTPHTGGGYGLDNVAIVRTRVDPQVSPDNCVVTPDPSQATITWETPPDPDVRTISIRYGSKAHPLTPSDGASFGSLTAVPGTRQQITAPIGWSGRNWLHLSVFAVKDNGEYSPPALAFVKVDKTAPWVQNVSVSAPEGGPALAEWIATDPDSDIASYEYACGRGQGATDVIPWTATLGSQIELSGLPAGVPLYVSVRARNAFGLWSYVAYSAPFTLQGVSMALNCRDDVMVTVCGVVAAVFSDCCYIEQPNRACGVKVVGDVGASEGAEICISGTMTTRDGGRVISVKPKNSLWLYVPLASREVSPNGSAEVWLYQTATSSPVTGYQAFLSFDTSMLSLGILDIIRTSSPYGIVLKQDVVGPNIDLAAGVDFGHGQPPNSSAALLAKMKFTTRDVEGTTQVRFRANDPPTQFTDQNGNPVSAVTFDSPTITIKKPTR